MGGTNAVFHFRLLVGSVRSTNDWSFCATMAARGLEHEASSPSPRRCRAGEGEATAKALELAAGFAKLPARAYAANKLTMRKDGIEVMKRDLGL